MENLLNNIENKIRITENDLLKRKKSVESRSKDYVGSVFNLVSETYYLIELEERLKVLKEIRDEIKINTRR